MEDKGKGHKMNISDYDDGLRYQSTDTNGKTLAVGDVVTIRDKLNWYDGEKGVVTKLSDYIDWHGKIVYNVHVAINRGYNVELALWPPQCEK